MEYNTDLNKPYHQPKQKQSITEQEYQLNQGNLSGQQGSNDSKDSTNNYNQSNQHEGAQTQQKNPQKSDENITNKVENTRDSTNISSIHRDESRENDLQQINNLKGENQINDDEEQQQKNKSKQTQEKYNIQDEEKKFENLYDKVQNEYYNNQPLSNYYSNYQQSKIKIGLPNLGMTCYINSAVQQLRQLYYIDNKIFGSSSFGQRFKVLFNHLENRNQEQVQNIMEQIVFIAKQQQKHQSGGGDAYICINNFLKQIRQELNSYQEKLEFDKNFLLKYSDQLQCSKCNNIIQDTKDQFTFYQYEEFGQECISFLDAFSNEGDQTLFQEVNSDIICDNCYNNKFFTKREYQVAPNFRMIRLLQNDQQPYNSCNNNLLEQELELMVKDQKQPEKYEIIGFCRHYSHHYKYFAKYDSEWIEFNDSYIYSLHNVSYLDYSKALFFVLKKVQNNQVKSEKNYNQQLSQYPSNLKQTDFTYDRQSDKALSKSFNRNDQKEQDSSQQNKSEQIVQDSDMSKQRNNHNENQQQNIDFGQKYKNNQQCKEETDKNTKLKKFVKVCQILPDLGDKQYIITVLQTLFQIFYFFDEDLFDLSTHLNQDFKTLIFILEEENIESIKLYFKNILMYDLQNRKYQKSKEAYSYFCDFLYDNMIKQEPQLANNFKSNFFITYKDYYFCQKCNFYRITEQLFTLQQQDLYNQMFNDDSFNENDLPTQYFTQVCQKCEKGYQNQKRFYLETPNFIIVNQNSQESNKSLNQKLNNIFQLTLYNNQIQKYQIIGFCSYSNQDYSYTIKNEDYWIQINKRQMQQAPPNCSNAQYFVLQKLTQQ